MDSNVSFSVVGGDVGELKVCIGGDALGDGPGRSI